jgi:hypothetical protein
LFGVDARNLKRAPSLWNDFVVAITIQPKNIAFTQKLVGFAARRWKKNQDQIPNAFIALEAFSLFICRHA